MFGVVERAVEAAFGVFQGYLRHAPMISGIHRMTGFWGQD